ncbi:NAD(P)/FAD-dependent oxidoreductase [Phanerochaete sordida]|uniref:NAD(P)/FAD-dependent oxidoreductase n=1 Tax=Phanerochaete sordida TaxID=48140 RepID=A0A9P3LN93_9APHY|nr:NAD(P)/FAD-dependent oxidoreductase [Phanerochaete sordida]
MSSTSTDPLTITSKWLATFASALTANDAQAVASTFVPNGWLRDVLTLTWDTRSSNGREAIARYLTESDRLSAAHIANIAIETNPHYAPRESFTPDGHKVGVETGFTYETRHGLCRGYAHLVQVPDGSWLAVTVGMVMLDLKAHPEPRNVAADWEATGRTWGELEAERKAKIESDPYVLVVGGGQNGLSTAARLRQMGVPTLVIEQNATVGESWRKRYQSLALHVPSSYCAMPYQPYPSHWPEYAPKDIIADFLESYAVQQHLTIWTKSTLAGRPRYDDVDRVWHVVVDRDGTQMDLRPRHIVLATGLWAGPRMPELPGRELFAGEVLHTSNFSSAAPFAGKRVVVVGAGNSSIDICQDLATGGAASVTMVQRSQSCVVSRSSVRQELLFNWPVDEPVEVGDFRFAAQPLGFFKQLNQSMPDVLWAREKTMHDKLRKGGIKLWLGPENEGQMIVVFGRGGGYWLDKGGADLVADGRIGVKQGASPTAFTKDELVFDDGTTLPADVVIFATGHERSREMYRRVFGEDVIDKTSDVWGLDEEVELQGCYRPTGNPGLWYAMGDFYNCRGMSKQLAMMIKASELDIYDPAKEQQGIVPSMTSLKVAA